MTNGLLLGAFALFLARQQGFWSDFQASASTPQVTSPSPSPDAGIRHHLTYEQWVALLQREAGVAAVTKPRRLSILLGDSLSLWFPPNLLPDGRTWLNQGISGETSAGLLERLRFLDRANPETIFLMIGINDLLRGMEDEALLRNEQQIIGYLKSVHPQTQIVIQSILPHAGQRATWEGRSRLKNIPNSRIRKLNRELIALANREGIYYLELHPLFTDGEGNLRPELTTDGLHLSLQGYWVWRSAVLMFTQTELEKHRFQNDPPIIGG
ncbi:GDSL-type esterase/lipase family protein [Leptolyngbya sp. 'hensonii']|uniref:GDSL-type esterase/lipase family protein n=1 Tax=Leptolyngbya sp. 'hensonii' TaxID=1922337 RepID=UPI00209AAF82|nr:GDSL-type esterase/lipase family protein [Leptolyngbya sp. 'hensonii']